MSTSPTIQLGASEKRQHEYLELDNGLKVVLVSDPKADKAAAALDVHVGHLHDPKELPGLAHFCEHLLFLGTEKYPKENVFSEYLARHGGSSNAYTSTDHTNYYFDVQHQWLEEAIDIWSQFFIHPLFLESSKDKEIQAVNSEHEKNINQDVWRLNQLDKSTSNPDHVYNRFGTGNLETLGDGPKARGVDVRDELIKFYHAHYSSNIMTLCIVGRQSLEELRILVLDKFSDIKNTNRTVDVWPDDVYGPDQLQRLFRVLPVKEFRRVTFSFPIGDSQVHYLSKPTQYIAHLIGHEGPGSLLSVLKAKGWALSTMAGDSRRANGFGVFKITVDVTEVGLEHVNDIGTLLFQYIELIKQSGVEEWIHEECASLCRIQLDFKDKESPSSYVSSTASNLHHYPAEHVISGAYLLFEYKPEAIRHFLSLLSPLNCRMTVVANTFGDIAQTSEEWYGTKYDNSPLDENVVKAWVNCGLHEALILPEPNNLIPSDFTIKERDEHDREVPSMIAQTNTVRLWHKHDDTFLLPKGRLYCDLVSPLAYVTPLNCVFTNLFAELLKDDLSEITYAAALGGLDYAFDNSMYGISFHVKGYTHKLGVLLDMIIDKIANFSFKDTRFEVLREQARQQYSNFEAEQPYHHCIYSSHLLSNEKLWTHAQKLNVLQSITPDDLRAFLPDLLSRVHVESFVHGNFTRKEARDFIPQLERVCLSGTGLQPSELERHRHVRFEEGYQYVHKKIETKHLDVTATEVYVVTGLDSTQKNVLIELFNQCIHESYFNQLRTNEQLGYIVHAGLRRQHGVNGMRFIIQGSKQPEFLASRVDVFLGSVDELISNMTEETFRKHVETLAAKKLEKPKTMSQESNKYWSEILDQQYHFQRSILETGELKKRTKDELLQFYRTYISPKSPTRIQVCLLAGPATETVDNLELNGVLNGKNDEHPADSGKPVTSHETKPQKRMSIRDVEEVVDDKLPAGTNALTTTGPPAASTSPISDAEGVQGEDDDSSIVEGSDDLMDQRADVLLDNQLEVGHSKNALSADNKSSNGNVGTKDAEGHGSQPIPEVGSRRGSLAIASGMLLSAQCVQKIHFVGEDVPKFKSTLGLYPQPVSWDYHTCLE